MAVLSTLLPEILQEIALYLALLPGPPKQNTVTHPDLLGPPSHLLSLLKTCKSIYNALSIDAYPSLYACIFHAKFDMAALERRRCIIGKFISPEWTDGISAKALATELKRRFATLKRLYKGIGTRTRDGNDQEREQDLWTACVLMLENDGKNALQLKHYACVEQWLLEYFQDYSSVAFDPQHMSNQTDKYGERWHGETLTRRLAMWLLWLTDTANPTPRYSDGLQGGFNHHFAQYILASHKFPIAPAADALCVPPLQLPKNNYSFYDLSMTPVAPSLSLPCIPACLTRKWAHEDDADYVESFELIPDAPIVHSFGLGFVMNVDVGSSRWDVDWERTILYAKKREQGDFYFRGYHAGMLDGSWEGIFTDVDGITYGEILDGTTGARSLDGIELNHYKQRWKLREYVLPVNIGEGWVAAESTIGGETVSGPPQEQQQWQANIQENGVQDDTKGPAKQSILEDIDENALPVGLSENAFFPTGTIIKEPEDHSHIILQYNNLKINYVRWSPQHGDRVRDVIILGQATSDVLGQTKIRGRIRRGDGLITLAEFIFQDQRRYASVGYITGGQVVGRWRECWSEMPLESTFYMGNHIRATY